MYKTLPGRLSPWRSTGGTARLGANSVPGVDFVQSLVSVYKENRPFVVCNTGAARWRRLSTRRTARTCTNGRRKTLPPAPHMRQICLTSSRCGGARICMLMSAVADARE